MHFSCNFVQARMWHTRCKNLRGEVGGWMARVAVDDLQAVVKNTASSQGGLEEPYAMVGKIFDFTSVKAQQKTFWRLCSQIHDRAARSLRMCANRTEVLVAWRGSVSDHMLEIINSDSGLPVLYSICIVVQTGRSAAEWRTSCGGKQRKRVRV